MKTKLRGHHLICLNFFRGEGYSEEFIKNIYSVIGKETVEIIKGADDVCAKCPYLLDGKCRSAEYTDEKILLQDKEALKLLDYRVGDTVKWDGISARIPPILEEWKALFCKDCGYFKVCFC